MLRLIILNLKDNCNAAARNCYTNREISGNPTTVGNLLRLCVNEAAAIARAVYAAIISDGGMKMAERKTPNKNLILASAGIFLQTAGSICMLVASAGMAKEANRKLRQVIVRELSKQLEETK